MEAKIGCAAPPSVKRGELSSLCPFSREWKTNHNQWQTLLFPQAVTVSLSSQNQLFWDTLEIKEGMFQTFVQLNYVKAVAWTLFGANTWTMLLCSLKTLNLLQKMSCFDPYVFVCVVHLCKSVQIKCLIIYNLIFPKIIIFCDIKWPFFWFWMYLNVWPCPSLFTL